MKRIVSQIIAALLHNSYFSTISNAATYQGFFKGVCPPTLNCYACPFAVVSCPIGAIQHFSVIRMFPHYVAGLLGFLAVIFGKLPCGWVCPFGLLQDLLAKISKIKLRLPRFLTYSPFITLAVLVVAIPYLTAEPWFSKLCPAGTLQAALPWVVYAPRKYTETVGLIPREMIGNIFYIKIAILAAILVMSVFITRVFCLLFCPMGAILALFNRVSIVRLHVSQESCSECNDSTCKCPVHINVRKTPNHRDCYRCMQCARGCDHIQMTTVFQTFKEGREESQRRKEPQALEEGASAAKGVPT
jgi:ferredoxin-type protein NapH